MDGRLSKSFEDKNNTEYALTAPLIANGGSTGFVAFKDGLKHQRYNGSPNLSFLILLYITIVHSNLNNKP